jgi:hypothetical protein
MGNNLLQIFKILVTCLVLCLLSHTVLANEYSQVQNPQNALPKEVFYKAKVLRIISEGEFTSFEMRMPYQTILLTGLDGAIKDKEFSIDYGKNQSLDKHQLVREGETVLLNHSVDDKGQTTYEIVDKYRLDSLIPIVIGFFLLIFFLGGWKGFGSILGMLLSLAVILLYIIPQIVGGSDPLITTVIGGLIIMITTIYLAHGFSAKTSIALLATFIILVLSGILSVVFVQLLHLSGLGTDDAMSLRLGPTGSINFKGLLLGGIAFGQSDIRSAYATGRGGVVVRGEAEIFETKNGQFQIIITSIPYRVLKSNLIENIADLVRDKKIEGIKGLRDESTKDIRVVIDLKSGTQPQKVLNYLYKHTELETTFHYNVVALVDGIPQTLALLHSIQSS